MLACKTERTLVRELGPDDAAEFRRVHEVSADHFADWIDQTAPEERLARALDKLGNPHQNMQFVAVAEDGRIAGFFNLSAIVRGVFNSAYASWYVNVEFARRGYGTEGVRALLDLAFSTPRGLGLHRVQANIIPDNAASIRLAERVGFRKEGIARRYLYIAGGWQDHVMYARTVEEHSALYIL
jgi:ribosomal-protein-alanine N-acetyltransferase